MAGFFRYILLDWLVEVATLKNYNWRMILATTDVIDRYLTLASVERSRLQLIGIASMVIVSRCVSFCAKLFQ